jgi:general nucleoside transport system permease protein
MINDLLQSTIIISMLAGMIRIATPILLAAIGVLITNRAGIMNLGFEGIMLMGAYMGFMVANQTQSIPLAILAAMGVGALMSLIMVFFSTTLKVDQTVTGIALNILAAGLSFFLYRVQYKTSTAELMPSVEIMQPVQIPVLSQIPVVGEVLFSQYSLTYFAFLMFPIIWFFLYKTKYGLEVRCLGENPRSIDMKGININRLQYIAVIIGGMFGGLGGAFLTIASAGIFVPDMSAGRGWLAIVVVIAGNWLPFRILLATLIFSFLDAFQLQAQGLGVQFPYQILLALPYVLAIFFVMGSRSKTETPAALGVPYYRE